MVPKIPNPPPRPDPELQPPMVTDFKKLTAASSVQIIDDGSAKSRNLFQGWCRKCCCVFRMERKDLDGVEEDVRFQPIGNYYAPYPVERGQAKCPQCGTNCKLGKLDEKKAATGKSWWEKLWEAFTA